VRQVVALQTDVDAWSVGT